jgi:hypothetical protein
MAAQMANLIRTTRIAIFAVASLLSYPGYAEEPEAPKNPTALPEGVFFKEEANSVEAKPGYVLQEQEGKLVVTKPGTQYKGIVPPCGCLDYAIVTRVCVPMHCL